MSIGPGWLERATDFQSIQRTAPKTLLNQPDEATEPLVLAASCVDQGLQHQPRKTR
jgi:hypothetical protein